MHVYESFVFLDRKITIESEAIISLSFSFSQSAGHNTHIFIPIT